jgi:hypothetical protein
MAVVMSSSLTVVRMGLALGWVETSLHNVLVAFPIALMASFLISSPIHRLVTWFASPTRPKPKNQDAQRGGDRSTTPSLSSRRARTRAKGYPKLLPVQRSSRVGGSCDAEKHSDYSS